MCTLLFLCHRLTVSFGYCYHFWSLHKVITLSTFFCTITSDINPLSWNRFHTGFFWRARTNKVDASSSLSLSLSLSFASVSFTSNFFSFLIKSVWKCLLRPALKLRPSGLRVPVSFLIFWPIWQFYSRFISIFVV